MELSLQIRHMAGELNRLVGGEIPEYVDGASNEERTFHLLRHALKAARKP